MKKVVAILMVVALMVVFTGCSKNPPQSSTEPPASETSAPASETSAPAEVSNPAENTTEGTGEKLIVGYSPQSMEYSYFQDVVKGMDAAIADSGKNVELIVNDPQMDASKQVTGIEELVAAHATSVIVCAVDLAAMPSVVDYVKGEKNLTLISHISPFEGADCYVTLEDYQFGKIGGDALGKYITENMNGKAKIAILHSKTVGENLVQRYQGYVDGIKEYAPNVEIVAEAAGYEEAMAMEALEAILVENPDIDIVVTNNDPSALGAYAALESANRTDVKISCIGSEKRVLEYIRDGKILYSVGDAAYETGYLLMQDAIKINNGEAVEKETIINCKLIDADVAAQMLSNLGT